MELRRPLALVLAIGALAWPIGLFGFGGFDDSTGAAVTLVGSGLVLGAAAIELALRWIAGARQGDQ